MMTDAFRDAIRAAGLSPPACIEPGRFHRFPGEGKSDGNTAGYCKLFLDCAGGIYGDHSTGLNGTWQATQSRTQTTAEREALRRNVEESMAQSEAKRKDEHAEAARIAAERWSNAGPADPAHPYLTRKGVKPYGIRQDGDLLLIPMRDGAELCSLQTIAPDGHKRFLPGGRVAGCYCSIAGSPETVCVVEGYATGAALQEATGHAVAVAFSAGNLLAVARALHARLPDAQIVVGADDDYRTAGNPGITKAIEAARAVGGYVAIPGFGADRPEGATDFNDLAQHAGTDAVKQAIANARAPEVPVSQPDTPNAIEDDLSGPQVRLIRGDAIQMRPMAWLWEGYIALGKVHIVAGAPGTGKTTLALGLAATITQGGRWPDGSRASIGDVLIWSGEDAAGDTLAPRLSASGADMSRVHFVDDVQEGREPVPFDPAKHIPALALAASRLPNLRMMIVDPIVSAVAGDSHQNAEVRRALAPLVTFAECADCALIGITHFTKGTQGREPLERVTGSLGFGAVARIVFGTAKLSEEDGGGRVLVRLKSNLGADGGGFKYDLRETELAGEHAGIVTTRVEWGDPIEGSAREILASAEQVEDTIGGNPKDFLRDLLREGPMNAADVFKDADNNGYSKGQMHRAKYALGVAAEKRGMKGGWRWSLPKMPIGPEDAEAAGHKSVAPSAPSAESSAPDLPGEAF
jgi:putative DNA primase/helicase